MTGSLVVSALVSKRATLAGELLLAEKHVAKLREDLASLDHTISVFDPTAIPKKIRPILRRKANPLYKRGSASREVLAVLRGSPVSLTAREIALRLVADKRLDVQTVHAMRALVNRVRNVLARQEGLAKERRDGAVAWSVA